MRERLIIDALGKVRPGSCQQALLNFIPYERLPQYVISGLDACFCRCSKCNGIWWYSQQMRDRSKEPNIRGGSPDAESLRDNE